MYELYNVNFNVNLKFFLRLFNCASFFEKRNFDNSEEISQSRKGPNLTLKMVAVGFFQKSGKSKYKYGVSKNLNTRPQFEGLTLNHNCIYVINPYRTNVENRVSS